MRFILIFLISLAASQASAEWRIEQFKDQMTDKIDVQVSLTADAPGGAELKISCQRSEFFPTALFPVISFPYLVSFGEIGINHRFDDAKVVPGIRKVSSNGRDIYLWLGEGPSAANRIRKSKRLRVEVFPPGRSGIFLNFDLAGAEAAISKIPCKDSRRPAGNRPSKAPDAGSGATP